MAEGFPLGCTQVIAGIDEVGIQIIQDVENRQNHKGQLNVASNKNKRKVSEKNLLGADTDKSQKFIYRAVLPKNTDKGIGLKQKIDPSRQDN